MPIYEYYCRSCDNVVEKIQREASADIPCPACGDTAQRRVSVFASSGSNSSAGACVAPPNSGFG